MKKEKKKCQKGYVVVIITWFLNLDIVCGCYVVDKLFWRVLNGLLCGMGRCFR